MSLTHSRRREVAGIKWAKQREVEDKTEVWGGETYRMRN